MAKQLVILRDAVVLEMYSNEYTDKATGVIKRFDTAFLFQSSASTGDKPRTIEARVHTPEQVVQLQGFQGKRVDICLEEITWRNGSAFDFFCTLDEFIRRSSAPPIQAAPEKKAASGS